MSIQPDPIQKQLIHDCNCGLVLVDAGPGTGKTATMVRRYVNILLNGKKENGESLEPSDILMLTFTRNAANEMEKRVRQQLYEVGRGDLAPLVEAVTFDSFCSSVISDSSDVVEKEFGIDIKPLRTSEIVGDEENNRTFFTRLTADFLSNNSTNAEYGEYKRIGKKHSSELLKCIGKLMSMGLIPKQDGTWFGVDSEEIIGLNDPETDVFLMTYIHDIYLEYFRSCIKNGFMTYGLTALVALMMLYCDPSVRTRNSYDYVMIDEFQDTSSIQIIMSLLILKQPNLCVIGDWKQGIYGFRNATIDNILEFEERIRAAESFINNSSWPLSYSLPDTVETINFENNYRSSERIIDASFKALQLKAFSNEIISEQLLKKIVPLKAKRTLSGDQSSIKIVKSTDPTEPETVSKIVKEYVTSDKYTNAETGSNIQFENIAILCKTKKQCTEIFRELSARKIPSYIQGEIDILTDTNEGSLVTSWFSVLDDNMLTDYWSIIMELSGCKQSSINNMILSSRLSKSSKKRYAQGPPQELRSKYNKYSELKDNPTILATTILNDYNMDSDYANSVIYAIANKYGKNNNTYSDIADQLSYEMKYKKGKYEVEPSINEGAVRVMTMHKSKGMEFEAVIIPYLDEYLYKWSKLSRYREPSADDDYVSAFILQNERIICTKKHNSYGNETDKENLESLSLDNEFDEDRRLLFVAMSRAKQYLAITYKPELNKQDKDGAFAFRTGLELMIKDAENTIGEIGQFKPTSIKQSKKPQLLSKNKHFIKLTPHDLMCLDNESPDNTTSSNCGGKRHGTNVHENAELMCRGLDPIRNDMSQLEKDNVEKIINHLPGSVAFPEIQCRYVIPNSDIIISGIIDLMLKKGDIIEIHDYKTDAYNVGKLPVSHDEYRLQVSVYAYAAMDYYKTDKVSCYVDYVSVEDCKFEKIKIYSRGEILSVAQQVIKTRQLN